MLKKLFFITFTLSYALAQTHVSLPKSYGCQVVVHNYYTIGMNPQHKTADWVMYQLTPQMASDLATDLTREDAFRTDPLIGKEYQGSDLDYRGSGYDRGHLCPAEDMDFNASSMLECFYYTNIVPQNSSLNRGWWRKLENQVREWALKDTVWVITGSICLDNAPQIGKGISVPYYLYKIVVDKNFKNAIAFVVPNEKVYEPLSYAIKTIDQIEQLSGYDFFPGMDVKQMESTTSNFFTVKP